MAEDKPVRPAYPLLIKGGRSFLGGSLQVAADFLVAKNHIAHAAGKMQTISPDGVGLIDKSPADSKVYQLVKK